MKSPLERIADALETLVGRFDEFVILTDEKQRKALLDALATPKEDFVSIDDISNGSDPASDGTSCRVNSGDDDESVEETRTSRIPVSSLQPDNFYDRYISSTTSKNTSNEVPAETPLVGSENPLTGGSLCKLAESDDSATLASDSVKNLCKCGHKKDDHNQFQDGGTCWAEIDSDDFYCPCIKYNPGLVAGDWPKTVGEDVAPIYDEQCPDCGGKGFYRIGFEDICQTCTGTGKA